VELGRIYIITDVSMLSTYLCLLHEGHLDALFHVFDLLVHHHNVIFAFDHIYPAVGTCAFIKTALVPYDAPVSRGKEVDLRLFVDSDHSGEQFTRHSRTGFVIYLNMAPIV
jgi:hypothetical protein